MEAFVVCRKFIWGRKTGRIILQKDKLSRLMSLILQKVKLCWRLDLEREKLTPNDRNMI